MWKRYFKFIKLQPGRVITPLFGELDFSRDDIPVKTIQELYENDFPYLEITEEGRLAVYGEVPPVEEPVPVIQPIVSKPTRKK